MRLVLLFALVALAVSACTVVGSSESVARSVDPEFEHSLKAWPEGELMPLLRVPDELVASAHIEPFEEAHSFAETEGEAEANTEADSEVEAEAETEGAADAEADADAETEVAAEAETETEAAADAETEAEAETETETATETEAEAEVDATAEAEATAEADAEAESAAGAEAELAAETESTAEAEAAMDAEAELVAGVEAESAALAAQLAAQGLNADMMTEAESASSAEHYTGVAWTSQIKGANCGSGWSSKVVPDYNMRTACIAHDACYGKCGSRKPNCDSTFYTNMKNICASKYKGNSLAKRAGKKLCQAQAYVYYKAVDKFGSGPFKAAQTSSCKK